MKKTGMYSFLVVFLFLLAVNSVFAGGKNEEPKGAAEDQPMTINVWAHSGNPADTLRIWGDMYTAEHPNVTFNVTTHTVDNYKIVAPLAVQNGQEKLDLMDFWASLAPDWVENGWLLELNQYLDQGMWDDVYDGPKSQYINAEGKVYFLPKGGHFLGLLYYNVDIFEELGITIDVNNPASEEDLIEICDKLNKAGYEGISVGNVGKSWMDHVFNDFIGKLLSTEDFNKLKDWNIISKETQLANAQIWKGDAVLEGFKVLAKYAGEGCFIKDINVIDWDPARELFVEGKAGMFMDGTWGINLIRKMADEDFNFSVAYFPPLNGSSAIPSTFGGGYAVPSYVKEQSPEKIPVIMDFLSKIYTEKYAIASMELEPKIPASKNVPEKWLDANLDPVLKKVIADSEVRGASGRWITGWDPEFYSKVNDTIAAVIEQTMTPEEAQSGLYKLAVKLAEERE